MQAIFFVWSKGIVWEVKLLELATQFQDRSSNGVALKCCCAFVARPPEKNEEHVMSATALTLGEVPGDPENSGKVALCFIKGSKPEMPFCETP